MTEEDWGELAEREYDEQVAPALKQAAAHAAPDDQT
jgi:hypothetical protein